MKKLLAMVVVAATAGLLGCDAFATDDDPAPPGALADAGGDTTVVPDGAAEAGDGGPVDTRACEVTFRYEPQGRAVTLVQVTGEWNAFAANGVPLVKDASGAFVGKVTLPQGLIAYKLSLDGALELDPGSGLRKYFGGVENSAVRVKNCHAPALSLATSQTERAGAGQGRFVASVSFGAAQTEPADLEAGSVRARLRRDGADVGGATATADRGQIQVEAKGLADGKYTLFVDASDKAGRPAPPLRLVFWVEAERFDWRGAVIYMVMVDRFRDGLPSNNPAKTSGVDERVDFQGGDLQGVQQAIADGTFDKLGVRALWLSPFHTNPAGPYKASDGVHQVMGYHGYWPVKAREVEPRIGGEAALKALVKEAHAHGIRVLQDFVVNHVHQEHEYFKAHPEWFRTGCVCGPASCDWTTHRLDCLFATYLPDVNWSVPAVSEQYGDDAVFWLDAFDIDGLRVDAVKHVEDLATMNLSARIRDEFEAAGTRVFLTGETAMGWNDCGLACNAGEYGTIARYMGKYGLDGQADFVLYHSVPYRVFSSDQKGMIHADYWAQRSQDQYPAGGVMTPYIGSHDTPRFVTLGQYSDGTPFSQWTGIAQAPSSAEPYERHRLAMTWLLTLPGAPLVYYGDEYGQWGGADPNNRVMWRGGDTLVGEEGATLARVQKLGAARRELPALRVGAYVPVYNTSEEVLVFGRQGGGASVLVALNKAPGARTVTVDVPASLGLAGALKDRLGGPDVTVSAGKATIALGPRGAALLAP